MLLAVFPLYKSVSLAPPAHFYKASYLDSCVSFTKDAGQELFYGALLGVGGTDNLSCAIGLAITWLAV